MAAPPSLYLRVIFTTILSSSNIVVHGFGESSCPENAIVDLTRNTSEEFPKNLTWPKDDRSFGCFCDIKTCVTLCCDEGMAQEDGWKCVHDEVLPETLPKVKNLTYKDFHSIVDNPCRFGWMDPSVITDFEIHQNGLLHAPHYDGGSPSDLEQYCLFREPGSAKFSAKVCRPWVRKSWWDIALVVIAILIMIIIFIGFTITPELRNLHGLIFRCYVVTYIGLYVCALLAELLTENKALPLLLVSCFESVMRYLGGCCMFWLNVMSFNIWRTFRWLRPVDRHVQGFNRKLFIWYAIYVWIAPTAIGFVPLVAIFTVPQFGNDVFRHAFKNWGCAAIVVVIFVSNGVFYTLTALRIREHKKDTIDLVEGVNKHHEVDRQWFNWYLKLFFIMGGHLIIWSVWLLWPTPEITHLFAALEVLQSILIFFIFLWTDHFKRSVSERVGSLSVAGCTIANLLKMDKILQPWVLDRLFGNNLPRPTNVYG